MRQSNAVTAIESWDIWCWWEVNLRIVVTTSRYTAVEGVSEILSRLEVSAIVFSQTAIEVLTWLVTIEFLALGPISLLSEYFLLDLVLFIIDHRHCWTVEAENFVIPRAYVELWHVHQADALLDTLCGYIFTRSVRTILSIVEDFVHTIPTFLVALELRVGSLLYLCHVLEIGKV